MITSPITYDVLDLARNVIVGHFTPAPSPTNCWFGGVAFWNPTDGFIKEPIEINGYLVTPSK